MTGRRIIVVTGGGSGIGRATAKRFAEDGDFVVVADIDEEGAKAVAGEIADTGGHATHIAVDVADDSSVTALADAVEDHARRDRRPRHLGRRAPERGVHPQHGHGRARPGVGRQLSRRVRVLPGVRRPDGRTGQGCIVNISSTSAIAAFPLHAYAPAKAALGHLTAVLASDLGSRGVRVNAVAPGYVLSEQMQARIDAGYRDPRAMERQSALGRIILPEEIADGIHFLCSDAARAITGISMPIDGGWLSKVTYVQHPGWPPKDWDPHAA